MKQVINGLSYDTETADWIAEYSNCLGPRDFRNCEEDLYKTKKGRFFLAGSGGPMTKYSEPCGDMTGSGSGIIPLDEDEALEWCEDTGVSADIIAEYFDVEEA